MQLSANDARILNIQLTPTGIELNPVSISASRRPEKILESPASISVLEARELLREVGTTTADALRNVTAIDMATTGIDRREMVLRGFNNAFSGSAYILTDYRRASVPSLDVNLHSIMPNMAIDVERVEIVRGPSSALYGAGVDAGVIHYLTKDALHNPGTTATFTGGERSTLAGSFRHAAALSNKFGYKITGQYAQADDWTLDPADSLDARQLEMDFTNLERNTDYHKFNINGLLQYAFNENVTLSANGGFSTLDATLLSGVGTVQAKGFGYAYGQLRLQAGNFFAQGYLNKNDAGDSFLYGTGQAVVDNSTLLNLQAQYDFDLADGRQQLIVGVDYERTAPDTDSTIFGRNEDDDLISEFGVYAQSRSRISTKLDLTAALRVDYNNIEDGFQFSPRAAMVFKPTPRHSFRATYNRAYSLPNANSLYLDIIGAETPLIDGFSIIQRGRGSKDGFYFNTARSGDGITGSGLIPVEGLFGENIFTYPAAGVPVQNVPMSAVHSVMYAGLIALPVSDIQQALADNGIELSEQVIDLFIQLLSPENITVRGQASSALTEEPVDVQPLKATVTQSLEIGYKGLLGEKVLLAIDSYYMNKKNFVSGVTQATPFSFLSNIPGELGPALAAGIRGNPTLATLLQLAGLSPEQVAEVMVGFAEEDLNALPVAVVQPDENAVPGEVLGAYRNFGNVDFWGIDASIQILATNRLNFFGNLSIVSDDFFDDKELDETGTGLAVALNAASFKWKAGFSYAVPNGASVNSSIRFTNGFPVLSGPYVGNVDKYFLWDVGAGYDMSRLAPGMRIDFTVQNVLDNQHREFIGAPRIGRLALARLSYTLP